MPEEQTNALGNIIDGHIYARDEDICFHTLSRVDIQRRVSASSITISLTMRRAATQLGNDVGL